MSSHRLRLGRLFGIPIGVQPAWILIVAVIAWSLGASYYPEEVNGISGPAAYGLGLASALLLFAGVLLHELGHALVARRRGVEIEEIDLWLLGGVARMSGQPTRAVDELAFAAAGPAVTLVLALICGGAAAVLPASAPAAVSALLDYLFFVNAAILGLNLLPAFPLDGGRIARALIWMYDGDLRKATTAAARLGWAIGWALVALGIFAVAAGLLAGFWTALIGGFIIFAAKAEERSSRLRTDLTGRRVGSLATPFPGGPLEVERHLEGLDPELIVDEDADLAELIDRPAFLAAGRALVRRADGSWGVIALRDVEELVWAVEMAAKPQHESGDRTDDGPAAGGQSRAPIGPRTRKAHR
ncbi:MAG TPA: site-2 protease family protein [Solirubrobacterales bacterium]|nr:site-2 protease family protein [Solirubrobacterales bacterium]